MRTRIFINLIISTGVLFQGCKCDRKDIPSPSGYNRTEMLQNLNDAIIIPDYNNFSNKLTALHTATAYFVDSPSESGLEDFQQKYKEAYLAWQGVEVYEFGPASDYILKSSLNSFPADTAKIKSNITAGTYDLSASGNIKAKGFPALDYLLFGIGTNNTAIVSMYTSDPEAINRKDYLNAIMTNMTARLTAVSSAWSSGYATTFVENSGTDLGSSVGLLVNSMSMSLESVRRERIGTPLGYVGLVNSGVVTPKFQEAYYSVYARELMVENLTKSKNLFNGGSGKGFDDYLNAINAQYETGTPLANEINAQYDRAIQATQALTPNYTTILQTDLQKAEAAFLEVKKLVVLIKLDMASQLGVVINYTDNDGD